MKNNLDDYIESLGFGKFNFKLTLGLCSMCLAMSVQIQIISVIAAKMKCLWKLTPFETAISSSSIFIGSLIGALFMGLISDKHGRKIALSIGIFMTLYFGVLTTCASNIYWFICLRIFSGFGTAGSILAPCLVAEYIPAKYRVKVASSLGLSYTIGNLFVAFSSWLFMNFFGWRIFLLFSALPAVIALITSIWIPESVRYLQYVNDKYKLVEVLRFISLQNNTPLPEELHLSTTRQGEIKYTSTSSQRKFFFDILAFSLVWIISLGNYYCIVLFSTELMQVNRCYGGLAVKNDTTNHECIVMTQHQYVFYIICAFGGLTGDMICLIFGHLIGRKTLILLTYFIVSVSVILVNFCLTTFLYLIILFIAQGGSGAGVSIVWLFTSEYFPTNTRTTSIGWISFISRLALIFPPFLVQDFLHFSQAAFTCVIVGGCLLGCLALILLEETKGKKIV